MSRERQRDTAALRDRVVWDVLPTARLPGWRIYTHFCVRTLKHCHPSFSLGPSPVSVWAMCLSRYPTKLARVQHGGLSPRRLGRGPHQLLWVILGPGLQSAHLLLSTPLSYGLCCLPSTGPWSWWACPSTFRIIFCLQCSGAIHGLCKLVFLNIFK